MSFRNFPKVRCSSHLGAIVNFLLSFRFFFTVSHASLFLFLPHSLTQKIKKVVQDAVILQDLYLLTNIQRQKRRQKGKERGGNGEKLGEKFVGHGFLCCYPLSWVMSQHLLWGREGREKRGEVKGRVRKKKRGV